MKAWIGAALIVAAAVAYEFVALANDDIWEWSEILNRAADYPFALVAVSWFIGFTMGHAMAPHVSRFARVLRGSRNGEIAG